MFGYVRPSQSKLTEEDRARFSAVYCGLCRVLSQRYGAPVSMILNYDFTFLALLLAEQEGEKGHGRCVPHPVKGRSYYLADGALELAADCSVILSWWQLQDGAVDHTGLKRAAYRLGGTALSGAYQKARAFRPKFDRIVADKLKELSCLETENCASMDQAADTFAQLMQSIAVEVADPVKNRVLSQFFYHLGRWIYLIDAVDDLKKDFEQGNYNPLITRFSLQDGVLSEEARAGVVLSLDHSIRLMAAAYELWDFGVWSPIIRATVYEGLFGVGKAVLEGTFQAGAKLSLNFGRDEETI